MSHPTWRLRLPASSRVPRYTAFVASILLGNYDAIAYMKHTCDSRGSTEQTNRIREFIIQRYVNDCVLHRRINRYHGTGTLQ